MSQNRLLLSSDSEVVRNGETFHIHKSFKIYNMFALDMMKQVYRKTCIVFYIESGNLQTLFSIISQL